VKSAKQKAKEKAWSALSKAVRYAHAYDGDNCKCVTCSTVKHWKELQAGHFIPKAQGNSVYFELHNVHPQCYRCNINLGSNGAEYYPYMLRTYGQGMIDRLKEKQQMIVTFREGDFNEIAKHYKEEFERIEQMRKDGHAGIIDLIAY
jgi:5-methylcytosine-specific restriction endonuclease McrA|tara:strand:+ start:5387 stop:5827 length:441 start_codon:yes stop_codon:yes gene_type:complete